MYVPQLATLVKVPPSGEGWCHEIKYDGYRIGCRIDAGRVSLISRNGHDWTAAYPDIVRAASALSVRDALIDGEVAVLLPNGRTSFQALQQGGGGTAGGSLVYFVFDLLRIEGRSVESLPLLERKQILRTLVGGDADGRIRFSEHSEGNGSAFLAHACRLGFEGIISKRTERPYLHGRTNDWLKAKCTRRQEFVIGGFTDPEGMRAGLGALLIGYYEGSRLVFAGKVGTGFTQAFAADLRSRLGALQRETDPFDPAPPRAIARRAHWVRPALVCEVSFTEWTGDGMIRHPSFQGLRTDKKPHDVRREREDVSSSADPPTVSPATVFAGTRLTHPERMVFAEPQMSVLDLARYYDAMASWIVPHVEGRPLTLLRCGTRGAGACRPMRTPARVPAPLRRVRIPVRMRGGDRVVVDDAAGIVTLADMGVAEIQSWNVRSGDLERPDRLVIDLEPGDTITWPRVVEAARHVRSLFNALDLEAFCKTRGGRGLQIIVPLVPHAGWRECLAFARALSAAMVRTDPDALTTSPKGRSRRLLVDYRGNDRGAASIAAFSTSARVPGSVAIPLAWADLLPSRPPDSLTIARVPTIFSKGTADPWAGYWRSRQKLTKERQVALDRHRS